MLLRPVFAALLLASLAAPVSAAGDVPYLVAPGDTLRGIAERHGVTVHELAEANELHDPDLLPVGTTLRLPDGRDVRAAVLEAPRESAPSFMSLPLLGRFTARFGTPGSLWKLGYHTGLDIAAPMGTTIRSAADGVVIEAEMHAGYGLYAKVDHGGGVHTLYGHMRVLGVAPGDQVVAGDRLGEVGMTGVTTGPHLHWEVRRDGVRENPEKYLP
jgi:murein DD-endopeptidase MepM/ murein hydrolase activator NlpD